MHRLKFRQVLIQRVRQRGALLAFFAVAMFGMVVLAGLGTDSGNMLAQNTRLQNSLDAAALSAAKTLSQTIGDTSAAQQEVQASFLDNANSPGNGLLLQALNSGEMTVSAEFSRTLLPFNPGSSPANYVRVRATGFEVPTTLLGAIGFSEVTIASTAVAGPSPRLTEVCNIAPMMVCGDPSDTSGFYGYVDRQPEVLKASRNNRDVGPGNFQLIRLDGNSGGADIRRAMAGDFDACVGLNDQINTEPGNTVGPTVQGINTRFGEYSGPLRNSQSIYPPDVVVRAANSGLPGNSRLEYDSNADQITFNGNVIETQADLQANNLYDFDDYAADVSSGNFDFNPLDGTPSGPGAFGRRTVAVPVGDCSVATNGQGSLPLLGVLCFHLLQPAVQRGNESQVYGQFVGNSCGVTGNPGAQPNNDNGPFIIQLYKDPNTVSS